MKFFIMLSLLLSSTITSAGCNYFIATNLVGNFERREEVFHLPIDKVLANKGYIKTYQKMEADFVIDLSNSKDFVKAESNFLTGLIDLFDQDKETNYNYTYSITTNIKVIDAFNKTIFSSLPKTVSGKTNDYANHFYSNISEQSVKIAADALKGLQECRELDN